uniref:hypothetical protein n=1 Tax=Ningiella ruwaisensis TaxID=2364274 RepID=UPI00109F2A43|nr:hypothetical protein [Ningiella ruwaisensis]
MAFYQLLLEGRNFGFIFNEKIVKGGFYTTRWVKANSPEEAEEKAVELIKNDHSLKHMLVQSIDTKPMIFLEEISTVSWFTYFRKSPGNGYTLYDEQNS